MLYEFTSRRFGKTTKLVEFVKSNKDYYLVVMNHRERERVFVDHGLDREKILTFQDLLEKDRLRGRGELKLVIDNADFLLSHMVSPHQIVAVSLSVEP